MSAAASSAARDGDGADDVAKWFPLESNPDVLNDYLRKLGLDTDRVHLVDVLSTEDWALAMVPRPVHAVVLLYPLTPALRGAAAEAATAAVGRPPSGPAPELRSLWFAPQRIGNACGTMALLHAVLNGCRDGDGDGDPSPLLRPDGWLAAFRAATAGRTPLERALLLEGDAVLAQYHEEATRGGPDRTARADAVEAYEDLETHFVAFVCAGGGTLVLLDGRKAAGGGPVDCGVPCTPGTLLEAACEFIKAQFVARDPEEMRFGLMALVARHEDDA